MVIYYVQTTHTREPPTQGSKFVLYRKLGKVMDFATAIFWLAGFLCPHGGDCKLVIGLLPFRKVKVFVKPGQTLHKIDLTS